MRTFCVCLVWACALTLAQSPEAGLVERHGNQATLTVDSPRPLDSAAMTLTKQFGIQVSAEDPVYLYEGDLRDVTAQVSRQVQPSKRLLVPKGGRLEIRFPVRADGSPADPRGLLETLVDQANTQFSFGYRLDVDGDSFTLVPTHTRDAQGRVIEATALLDRRVTIPWGTRSVAETAGVMAAALSAQTGMQVSCCQSFVAGFPWGMTEITFEAHDEPARSVLKKLIAASLLGQPTKAYNWVVRCDPTSPGWCFINLMAAVRPTAGQQTLLSSPANHRGDGNPARWFNRAETKK